MKYKKFAAMLAAVLAAMSLFCGCANDADSDLLVVNVSGAQAGRTEITFFGNEADNVNLVTLEGVFRRFMIDNPKYNVLYEGVYDDKYWSALDRRVSSGATDSIFMVNPDCAFEYKKSGLLADLSDIVDKDMFSDHIREQVVSSDGKMYYVPLYVSVYGLFANHKLLKKYGKSVPVNAAEFADVCDYCVSRGATPIVANSTMSMRVIVMAAGMNEVYFSSDPNALIAGFNADPTTVYPYLAKGLEYVANMIDRGWINCDEVLGIDQDADRLTNFVDDEHERLFMITDSSTSANIQYLYPNFEHSINLFPVLDNGGVLVRDLSSCIAVNKNADDLYGVKKLVSSLMSKNTLEEYALSQLGHAPTKEHQLPSDKVLQPILYSMKNDNNTVLGMDYRFDFKLREHILAGTDILLNGGTLEAAKAALLQGLASEGGAQ